MPPQKPVAPKAPASPAKAPPKPAPVATTIATPTPSADDNLSSKDPELEKRRRRAERFGIPLVAPKQNVAKEPPAKKSSGEARFFPFTCYSTNVLVIDCGAA